MEMPEQEVPVIFSQMLKMFPNIPHDIIWMYVQQYSGDVTKCAQMLSLENAKYELQIAALDSSKNLNESINVPWTSNLILRPGVMQDNNNVALQINLDNESNEQESYDSHSSYSTTLPSALIIGENVSVGSSRRSSSAVNFNEPLTLDIAPDDASDMSHSWRPNFSADIMCSDFFMSSSVFGNRQRQSNHVPNLNFDCTQSEFHRTPSTVEEESGRYSAESTEMLCDYPYPERINYGSDITSYLHYQKSQMNAIRYEVIKAKIEFSDIKDNVERLGQELKEKMQSKSAQDILELNKEIEQLRLDCQCLCSEIDSSVENPVLGEIDERLYEQNRTFAGSSGIETATTDVTSYYGQNGSTDIPDESNRWQCPECTFANHPAINVCEMCQVPKTFPRRPSYLPIPPASCYCHSKENSLSVQS